MRETVDTFEIARAIAVIVLGATGTWLLLPHRHGRIKPAMSTLVGGVLSGIALLLLATLWKAPATLFTGVFFYLFALAAIAGGVLTITSRNPVYSALWFAAVVLATSGLFLLSGAQFLAAGTIIVYAGAIIVTFLFVIMLAQKEGRATYDRMARSPGRATATCFLLFWSLLYALIAVKTTDGISSDSETGPRLTRGSSLLDSKVNSVKAGTGSVVRRSLTQTNRLPEIDPAPNELGRHVAGLGGTLYTDHLVTVELVGALLFAALIGALAIATPKPPIRPGSLNPPPPAS
jgi:NADH-quinone oxidoreductase subunit J